MLLGTATDTSKCLWALRITFCGDNWKRLAGYLFTLRSRGAYLSVASAGALTALRIWGGKVLAKLNFNNDLR